MENKKNPPQLFMKLMTHTPQRKNCFCSKYDVFINIIYIKKRNNFNTLA